MEEQAAAPRFKIRERLAFLDFRLFWEGHVRREALESTFGISTAQASADLHLYLKETGDKNAEYDKSRKRYVRKGTFEPAFFDPTSRQYLSVLNGIADGVHTRFDSWLGQPPPFDAVRRLRRRIMPGCLSAVLDAIREKRALHINYQSFTSAEPQWRWITPHAILFDGFRWHARAWCHRREVFHDFVFARMLKIEDTYEHQIKPEDDAGWNETVVHTIVANPRLEDAHRNAVEIEYEMEDHCLRIKTRVCLSAYLERFLGLDLNADLVDAKRQQIVLQNAEEVRAIRRQLLGETDAAAHI